MIRRRRLFAIAAAAALPAGYSPPRPLLWTGTVLGAHASITLYHPDRQEAERLIGACLDEVERLEQVFSLYRAGSELSRLNAAGVLAAPSLDLRRLLAESLRYGALSDGAFDVSVQPLWRTYAAHFAAHPDDEAGPDPAALAAARALVDYRAVLLDPRRIGFARPGMAITLNGIAQGYIADRVADLLRAEGLRDVLLDLGEIRALGRHPDGSAWRAGIRRPPPGNGVLDTMALSDRAMATSGGYGTLFDRQGRFHHLLSPATGAPAPWYRSVTIIADRATDADALSTAVAVMPPDAAERLIEASGVSAVVVRPDGQEERLGRPA